MRPSPPAASISSIAALSSFVGQVVEAGIDRVVVPNADERDLVLRVDEPVPLASGRRRGARRR